jgi:large subunit ribosomal protein L4
MTKLALFDMQGKNIGDVKASEEVFGQKIVAAVVHSAVLWLLAARRRGTHSTLTRAEVRGGGIKPWRQKGTGRARAGSIRSPLWRKGGVVFGPKPRDYNYTLPKKIKKKALKIALSDKVLNGKLKVVEEFKIDQGKTKLAVKVLKGLKVEGKVMLILDDQNEMFMRAARNIAGVSPIFIRDLNILDLLHTEWVVAEKKAVARLEEVLA